MNEQMAPLIKFTCRWISVSVPLWPSVPPGRALPLVSVPHVPAPPPLPLDAAALPPSFLPHTPSSVAVIPSNIAQEIGENK